jgi:hypothetical protein
MRYWFQWLFVGILTAAPFAVGLQAYALSPSLPTSLVITLWQQFLPVFLLSIAVAISSACVLFVPAYLHDWPLDIRLIFLTLLAFLTVVILWIAIMLAYVSLAPPDQGTALAPAWVFYVGGTATLILILGILYWADQLYLRSLGRSDW